MPATGAKPQGATTEADAAQAVRQMFDSIAPRYTCSITSSLPTSIALVAAHRAIASVQSSPTQRAVLDICCGTGDMTMALLKLRPRNSQPSSQRTSHAPCSPAVLSNSEQKAEARQAIRHPLEADALHLPLKDAPSTRRHRIRFRNLANYESGLVSFTASQTWRPARHPRIQ